MPTVGYLNDPDGANFAYANPGHLFLQWVDGDGQLQQRYYDGKGERADGSGETLAGDFVRHMVEGGAIVPAWQGCASLARRSTDATNDPRWMRTA
jgi:hypothetical protein